MIALATRYDVSAQVASSIGRRKISRDVRQRHVHHRGVEHLHEGGEHHRHRDQPRIDVPMFGCRRREGSGMRQRTNTVGTTRHPRAETVVGVLSLLERNLQRHALNDFYEVATRVLGRQQAEARPGRAAMLSIRPVNFCPPSASTEMDTDWPTRMESSWVSLKFAVTHRSSRSTSAMRGSLAA